jgi:large subunit ribosomal protein L29
MKINEIRDLTVDELRTRKHELSREAFNLRMQKTGGQLEKPHLLRTIRRDIARIESVISQKSKKA